MLRTAKLAMCRGGDESRTRGGLLGRLGNRTGIMSRAGAGGTGGGKEGGKGGGGG